jgi:hypothetical protein
MHKDDADMRIPLVPLVAAAATACAGLSAASAGTTSGATSGPATETAPAGIDVQVPDSNDRVDGYWTQDRMRAATPMPTPRISRPSAPPAATDDLVPEE